MLVSPADVVARAKATIKECSVRDVHDCLHSGTLLVDIREPAAVLLEIELPAAANGQLTAHALAHRENLRAQVFRIDFCGQHLDAQRVELAAQLRRAGDSAGTQQCLMLPDPGIVELVSLESVHTGDEQTGLPARTQPGVDFIEPTRRGLNRQHMNDPLSEPGEELPIGDGPRTFRFAGLVAGTVYEDQIQIRTVAEFETTEFSVSNDGESAGIAI